MTADELRAMLGKLVADVESAGQTAKTAEAGRQSLTGSGRYAQKFHDAVVAITAAEGRLRPHFAALQLSQDSLQSFDHSLATVKGTTAQAKDRTAAVRSLRMVCEAVIVPRAEAMTASPVPVSEQVLPQDVVRGTRGFVERIVTQANGCYEHQWYDACSVMVRKLAEVLIVAVYDAKGAVAEIAAGDGQLLPLSKLIAHLKTKQTAWSLDHRTVGCLDEMKRVGDAAAHIRHYMARKKDVDDVLGAGLRYAVEDLLHHAGWRK